MAHIMGFTLVSSDRLFAMDEYGGNFQESPSINATTAPVSVGQLIDPDFRVYVGTGDGNIALFQGPNSIGGPPQLFHVTVQPVLWSLYHAAGTIYLGTGDFSASGPFPVLALDDRNFGLRWLVLSSGPVVYPAGVGYVGNAARQVIFSSGNPGPSVRALDVASGNELWSVPDYAFGQKVHDGVVYYGNLGDSTLRARSASDGTLLWSFKNPSDFNFQVPVVAGGVVWASSVGNQVFAFRASDGSVLWEVQLGGHPGAPVVHFDHVWGTSLVAVAEQDGGTPGYLIALDPNTGATKWISSVPVSQPGWSCSDPIVIPHFENGFQVQVGTFDGTLLTFNALNGRTQLAEADHPWLGAYREATLGRLLAVRPATRRKVAPLRNGLINQGDRAGAQVVVSGNHLELVFFHHAGDNGRGLA